MRPANVTTRTRRGDQHGFALLTVLAVIAITALVFGALLGLMLVTIRITANHQKVERERRAADGAIVTTLNHLRLGDPGAGCGDVPDRVPGYRLDFDLPASSDTVEVTCTAGADEYGDPAGEVKLVGDRYSGTLTDWRSAWPWSAAPGGALAALGVTGVEPSLVHVGAQPLRFNGHVNSVAGAAALRDPAGGTPAMDVRGQYRQGAPGLGATGTDCGLLGEPGSPLFIDAVAGLSCGDLSALSDANPADYAIDPVISVLPAVTTGVCPSGPVVTFSPGRYDRRAVAVLNKWFGGDCPGRTFHFPSGRYWFDASDATRPEGERNALVIDDPTSSFVFGQPKGWTTATGADASVFPDACAAGVSATSPGSSIVLSGRTSLIHRGGRLAVCPYVSPDGVAYPAILQQRTIPTTIQVSAGVEKDFTPAANLVSGDATNPTDVVTMGCVRPYKKTKCVSEKTFAVTLSSDLGPEPVEALRLGIVGDEPNYPVSVLTGRSTTVEIDLGATSCSTLEIDSAPVGGRETSFDLMSGTCADLDMTGADLDGATLTVILRYSYDQPLPLHWVGLELVTWCSYKTGCPITTPQELQFWDVRVAANEKALDAARADESKNHGWRNVPAALVDDAVGDVRIRIVKPSGQSPFDPCDEKLCLGAPAAIRAQLADEKVFTVDDVALDPVFDPGDEIESLGVVVKQVGQQVIRIGDVEVASLVLNGDTRITVTLPDGRECTKNFGRIINRAGDTYYPIMAPGSSLCGEVQLLPGEATATLFDGASITFGIVIDPVCDWVGSSFKCGYVRPIPIQYVGLMATTDSYKGPVTRSVLTIDSTTSGSGSSANFFGAGHMPHSSLDLLWKGPASGMSLFGGELQLDSLGSHMDSMAQTDVVCCTKPEQTSHEVRLTAHVAGRPVLSVVAVLAPDRSAPEILEWTQCGRNGACGPGS